ncbi:hypothetical protein [Phosphitispora fastidiosa]|uniref:hypothetical protein n=1 Tax=Phosphitispora fastidiosa TaxID=2837202 RepID=UPI001E4A060F|nr:hypothetical protein [Phosphitispora fastidiosa]MBU7007083.1 hypothetical protein [Phosphitispora fastidiosa]
MKTPVDFEKTAMKRALVFHCHHKNASKFGCRDRLEEIQKEAKRIKRQMDCWCK